MKNSNYVKRRDGWHKIGKSKSSGNASFFEKDPPPMRDSQGRPMKNYNEIDTAKWIQEVNEKDGK